MSANNNAAAAANTALHQLRQVLKPYTCMLCKRELAQGTPSVGGLLVPECGHTLHLRCALPVMMQLHAGCPVCSGKRQALDPPMAHAGHHHDDNAPQLTQVDFGDDESLHRQVGKRLALLMGKPQEEELRVARVAEELAAREQREGNISGFLATASSASSSLSRHLPGHAAAAAGASASELAGRGGGFIAQARQMFMEAMERTVAPAVGPSSEGGGGGGAAEGLDDDGSSSSTGITSVQAYSSLHAEENIAVLLAERRPPHVLFMQGWHGLRILGQKITLEYLFQCGYSLDDLSVLQFTWAHLVEAGFRQPLWLAHRGKVRVDLLLRLYRVGLHTLLHTVCASSARQVLDLLLRPGELAETARLSSLEAGVQPGGSLHGMSVAATLLQQGGLTLDDFEAVTAYRTHQPPLYRLSEWRQQLGLEVAHLRRLGVTKEWARTTGRWQEQEFRSLFHESLDALDAPSRPHPPGPPPAAPSPSPLPQNTAKTPHAPSPAPPPPQHLSLPPSPPPSAPTAVVAPAPMTPTALILGGSPMQQQAPQQQQQPQEARFGLKVASWE